MTNLIRRTVCAIALISCFALPALADSVTYSDVSSGVYSPGGYLIGDGYVNQSIAAGFTATVSGALSAIDVGLGYLSGASNTNTVSLYADAGGTLGTLLFQGTVSGILAPDGTSLYTPTGSYGASLTAGDSYFVTVQPSGDYRGQWSINYEGVTGTILGNNSFTGPGWHNAGITSLGAFDVRVDTAVPEPSTWLMLGAEVICLLGFLRVNSRFQFIRLGSAS